MAKICHIHDNVVKKSQKQHFEKSYERRPNIAGKSTDIDNTKNLKTQINTQ